MGMLPRDSAYQRLGGDGFSHRFAYRRRGRLWAGVGLNALLAEEPAGASTTRGSGLLRGRPRLVADSSTLQ